MPDPITRAEVERMAALGHLALEADEVELLTRQLAEFLGYAREIGAVPPAELEEAAGVDLAAGRPDVVAASLPRRDVLRNAPEAAPDAGLFKVPRVIGD